MSIKVSITRTEIEQMHDEGRRIVLVDVRSKAEYEENHIPEAVNISIEEIEAGNLSNVRDKNAVIVTACGKGGGAFRTSRRIPTQTRGI